MTNDKLDRYNEIYYIKSSFMKKIKEIIDHDNQLSHDEDFLFNCIDDAFNLGLQTAINPIKTFIEDENYRSSIGIKYDWLKN